MKRLMLIALTALCLMVSSANGALREGPAASKPTSGSAGQSYIVTDGATALDCTTGGGAFMVLCTFNGTTWSPPFPSVASDCADGTATPADCGAALTGSVIISAGATAVVVNTTGVTASSRILIFEDSSLGTRLSVTCNTTIARTYAVTARTAATSFTITASAAPTTNPACLHYMVVN